MKNYDKNYPYLEYKGYKYCPSEDCDGDCIKTWHDVYTPDGKNIHLDYSPFSSPSFSCFKKWIAMGMPERHGPGVEETLGHNGNFKDEDIEKLWNVFLQDILKCPCCQSEKLERKEEESFEPGIGACSQELTTKVTHCCDNCGCSFEMIQEAQDDLIIDILVSDQN